MTYQLLGKILRNPLYAGLEKSTLTEGELVPSVFGGLITPVEYCRIQERLSSSRASISTGYVVNNPMFPLRRFMKCGDCKSPLRGSSPRGRSGKSYPKYHCQGKGCLHRSVTSADLNERFVRELKNIHLTDKAQKLYKTLILRVWNDEMKDANNRALQVEKRINEIKAAKQRALDKLIADEITNQEKNEYYAKADKELAGLSAELSRLQESASDKEKYINHSLEFLANVSSLWENSSVEMQIKYQAMIFPKGIEYDFNKQIFRTTKISAIYRLATIKKEPSANADSLLVTLRSSNWNTLWGGFERLSQQLEELGVGDDEVCNA